MNRRRFIAASAAATAAGALVGSVPAFARPSDPALSGLYCELKHHDGRESREPLTITDSRRHRASFAIARSTNIDAIHFGISEPSFRRFERSTIAGPFEARQGDIIDVSYFCGALWVSSFSLARVRRIDAPEDAARCPVRGYGASRPWPINVGCDDNDDRDLCDGHSAWSVQEPHGLSIPRSKPVA